MKQETYLIFVVIAVIIIAGTILISNYTKKEKGIDSEIKISSPLSIELLISPFTEETKTIGRQAEITATVSAIKDVDNVNAEIILPEGLKYISGDLKWQGNVTKDTPITFSATIETIKIGDNWKIEGRAIHYTSVDDPFGYTFGDSDFIYVTVSETEILISNEPVRTPHNRQATQITP